MSLYTKGQLVWAKVKGYPWWPAVIAKTNQDRNGLPDKEILVNFVGDNSHAILTQDKVVDFNEKFKQHSTNKNKKLQDSIRIARKILDGLSTFEEEREKLEKDIARSQASPEAEDVKPTSRGRPSSKKKLEGSGAGTTKDKEVSSGKVKESTSKSKEISQKEKEKGLLYKFKEDVLGLQINSDTLQKEKASTTSVQEKENTLRDKASPKSQKQVKDSRLTQKQKAKEKEKEKKLSRAESENYQDYLPFRLTRAQSKRDPSDGHTEPSSGQTNRERAESSKGSKKENSTGSGQKHVKNNKETPNKPTKAKGRLLLDEDDVLDNLRRNISRAAPPAVEEKPVEEDIQSPGKFSERKYSEHDEKKVLQEQNKVERPARKASGPERMDVEGSKEAGEGLKGLEIRKSSGSDPGLNNKRKNSSILRDSPPIYSGQVKDKEDTAAVGVAENSDYITKKVKVGVNSTLIEEEEVLDERALGTEVYNMLLIKRFEENLRRILDKLSVKLQGTDRLKEYDADMIKMLGIIEEFEGRTFAGSEFVGSDLGKILKTIHFLLIKNKPRLPKTGDLVITALAKIIHKIKDKILKFCLDNTEYMEALHLPQEATKPISMTAIDIDFEEIKAKIEEGETKVEPGTKIEEENTATNPQVPKPVAYTAVVEANPPKVLTVQQQNTPAVPTYSQSRKESIRDSPVIKAQEANANEISLLLRKKICQKLAKLLQRSYSMDKEKSQKLTLHIEDKLNKFYLGNVHEYKQAIKGLHKLIKNQSLTLDELTQVLDMTIYQFNQMMQEKLPEMTEFQGNLPPSAYNDMSPHMNTEEVEKRELPLLNEDSTTFDFDACLKAKLDSDMALNSVSQKIEGDVKPKMLVEQPNSFIQDLFQTKEEEGV